MFLEELKIHGIRMMKLLVDNKSIIDLTKHLTTNGKSRHTEKRFHFLKDQINIDEL